MKFKIKTLDISTGGALVALINQEDAQELDLHAMDRIKLIKGRRVETAAIDIAKSSTVKPGYIGIFEEVAESLGAKNNDIVELMIARKPVSLAYIRKKLDGVNLSKSEIDQIVWDIVHNKLSDVELAYFVAACYTNVLTMDETVELIKSMVKHGETLKIRRHPIIDKHCIGGVPGNRTTMVIVPIIAAAGYTIPKTSSRSITSPAGTADTMEVLCNVTFPIKRMKRIVEKSKGCIVWGGSLNLAPADDKIIRVEKPLGIDAESQLLASIMAKKYSVSSTHILIDIPTGDDAKVKTMVESLHLKKGFETIGRRLGKRIKVLITDGSQPVGNGIGPALEARDVLWLLKRDSRCPKDLEAKCIMMASEIFKMIGVKKGYELAREILESGKAYRKFMEIVKLQKGKEISPESIKIGRIFHDFNAARNGTVRDIDNILVSKIARIAGAPAKKSAGMYIYKHIGDKVSKGERLFTVYSESNERMEHAKSIAKSERVFVIR